MLQRFENALLLEFVVPLAAIMFLVGLYVMYASNPLSAKTWKDALLSWLQLFAGLALTAGAVWMLDDIHHFITK